MYMYNLMSNARKNSVQFKRLLGPSFGLMGQLHKIFGIRTLHFGFAIKNFASLK